MPVPKCLQCLPCFSKKTSDGDDVGATTDDKDADGNPIFKRNQITKAVAIVLTSYDSELAAASVGEGCTPEMVDVWVSKYRPPFFEEGMRCPPALIDWWMQELDRKADPGNMSAICSSDGFNGDAQFN